MEFQILVYGFFISLVLQLAGLLIHLGLRSSHPQLAQLGAIVMPPLAFVSLCYAYTKYIRSLPIVQLEGDMLVLTVMMMIVMPVGAIVNMILGLLSYLLVDRKMKKRQQVQMAME